MKKGALVFPVLVFLLLTACTGAPSAESAGTLPSAGVLASDYATSAGNEEATQIPEEVSEGDLASIDRADIKNEGVEIIEDQSFDTDLESFGKARFVSAVREEEGRRKARFYLLDENGKVLYLFPDFSGNEWPSLDSVRAVGIKDVDGDGQRDVVIIAAYLTGAGADGAVPFPVCGIYFQQDRNFTNSPELDREINDKGRNETVDMVVKYMASRGTGSGETAGSTGDALSQETIDKVGNYTEFIDTEKDTYSKKEVELVGYSTEGGTATGYFNAGSLSYIEAGIMGELGKVELYIYCIDDSLRYVVCTTVNYDKPITQEGSKEKEENTISYLINGNKLYEYIEGGPSPIKDTGLIETVGSILKEFKE